MAAADANRVMLLRRQGAVLLVIAVALVGGHGCAGRGGQTESSEAILFERNGDLYALAVGDSRTVRLTTTRTLELEPAVSPDGRSIAYALRSPRGYERVSSWTGFVDDSGGELWTIGVDGERRTRVTLGSADADPAWSPDGDTIFFSRVVRGEYYEPCRAIFSIRKDGRQVRRLTRTVPGGRPDGELNPIDAPQDLAVSPDGRRIVFTDEITCETTDVSPNLEVIDTSGRLTDDFSQFPASDLRGHANPTWSPDGSLIAFERSPGPANLGVFVANPDGSGHRRMTPARIFAREPAWSPDGTWIAFVADGDLYVIRPDGTGLRRLTRTSADESSPAWLPQMPTG